jgi:selenoprotein W-related protein
MQVEIEYCGMWGYEPRARKVREMMLAKMPSAKIHLRKSGGGVFEITVDGKLAYSKKATGRFPTDEEVLATLGSWTDPIPQSKGSARCLPRAGGVLKSKPHGV